jgi:hypothetical protein
MMTERMRKALDGLHHEAKQMDPFDSRRSGALWVLEQIQDLLFLECTK